jgi:hypothetical protein
LVDFLIHLLVILIAIKHLHFSEAELAVHVMIHSICRYLP